MPDLTDTIEFLAENPASASNSMGSVAMPNIKDMVEADKYLKGQAALEGTNENGGAKSGWRCLRPARAVPPGSV